MTSNTLPHTTKVENALRLANDLELLAEERAELGDAREANELRVKASMIRRGVQDEHNAHVSAELERAKSEPINLSDLMAARETFEVQS